MEGSFWMEAGAWMMEDAWMEGWRAGGLDGAGVWMACGWRAGAWMEGGVGWRVPGWMEEARMEGSFWMEGRHLDGGGERL